MTDICDQQAWHFWCQVPWDGVNSLNNLQDHACGAWQYMCSTPATTSLPSNHSQQSHQIGQRLSPPRNCGSGNFGMFPEDYVILKRWLDLNIHKIYLFQTLGLISQLDSNRTGAASIMTHSPSMEEVKNKVGKLFNRPTGSFWSKK